MGTQRLGALTAPGSAAFLGRGIEEHADTVTPTHHVDKRRAMLRVCYSARVKIDATCSMGWAAAWRRDRDELLVQVEEVIEMRGLCQNDTSPNYRISIARLSAQRDSRQLTTTRS